MIFFTPLTPTDFPLLLAWLAKPHVKEWWDDGDDTLEKVEQNYGAEEGTEQFLIYYRADESASPEPVGYIQSYQADENVMGIDLFLGEEHLLNLGIGTRTLQAFIAHMVEQHAPASFVIDPDPHNARAIRCYEKIGFRHVETILTEEGKPAYMMRLTL